MKTITKYLMCGLLATALSALVARADLEVEAAVQIHTAADFYAPLGADGAWVDVRPYGRCWRPDHVALDWRPYCDGRWVWTDCGWYWASADPWAWACYHYGYWFLDPDYGWVWVPGIEWAPAWVEWRVGGGYCGWAPLGPPGFAVIPRSFVFVELAHFDEPVQPSDLILNSTAVFNRTRLSGNLTSKTLNLGAPTPQRVMFNPGPRVNLVQRATGKRINAVPIATAVGRTPTPSSLRALRSSTAQHRVQPKSKFPDHSVTRPGSKAPNRTVSPRGHLGEPSSPAHEAPSQRPVLPPQAPPPRFSPHEHGPGENPPGHEGHGHHKDL